MSDVQRLLGKSAAWLFVIALFTGIFAGAAMSKHLHADGHTALASHLSALMGVFLLSGLAFTMPMLSYGDTGKKRIAIVLIVTSYANWIITAVKSTMFVSGIDLVGDAKNDGVFVVLQIFLVIPTIAAAIAWALGFRKKASA